MTANKHRERKQTPLRKQAEQKQAVKKETLILALNDQLEDSNNSIST